MPWCELEHQGIHLAEAAAQAQISPAWVRALSLRPAWTVAAPPLTAMKTAMLGLPVPEVMEELRHAHLHPRPRQRPAVCTRTR